MFKKLCRFGGQTVVLGTVAALSISSVAGAEEPTSAAPLAPSGIAASLLRHLDVTTPLAGERRRLLVRQSYGSLQHLSDAVYVSEKLGTASSTILHLDLNGRLRNTQFTVGAEGGLVVDSSLVEDGDMVRSIVVYGAGGIISRLPTGIEEVDDVGPCIDASLGAEDPVQSILDCLGLGGSGSADPGIVQWLDQLRNPDCENSSIASDKPVPAAATLAEVVATLKDKFGDSPGIAAAAAEATEAIEAFEAAVDLYSGSERSNLHVASLFRQMNRAVSNLYQKVKDLPIPSGGSPMPFPDGGQAQGSVKDPRCEQRKTDSARGTLFANSDFCKSEDMLQCLAEEQDPIRRITDGKCKTTEGHDGRAMLTCGDNTDWNAQDRLERSKEGASSDCGASPDGGQSYCDFNVPFENTGDIGKGIIDTMDLGPVFDVLCAFDGCGIPQF